MTNNIVSQYKNELGGCKYSICMQWPTSIQELMIMHCAVAVLLLRLDYQISEMEAYPSN